MNELVKNEFYAGYSAISFCHACLSTDRTLSAVSEYINVFYRICDQDMVRPNISQLCWECIALLKRVNMFSKKVSEAQRMLQYSILNKQETFPQSLSCLKTTQITNKINEIKITFEEPESKPIKDELDFDDHFDNFEYLSYENIKDEIEQLDSPKLDFIEPKEETEFDGKTEKKLSAQINEKRKAKYRFVNTNLRKHRRYLIRTVPVDESEVLPALVTERKNEEFLKAEHKCLACVEQFKDEDRLAKHLEKYHDESLGPHSCNICLSRFPTTVALLTHSSKHLTTRHCKVCGWESVAPSAMARHMKLHHRIVQCISCGLFFDNVRLFYKHYKALHGRFICDVCGKICRSRNLIERHLKYHFGYECPHCKKVLKNSSSYNNHIECQHTNSYSDDAYCVPCDRRFKNVKLYKRHLMDSSAHAGERDCNRNKRKFPCPECGNVYSRKTFMNNHYRFVHSKQSKHYCEDCDRQFLNRTRYLDHRRYKHEGAQKDKDKLCNICGRGFAAKRTLINHIRTHSGERPYACEYCSAKFTQKHAMLSHVKFIHMKNKRKPSWHE